jgi:hypothetical protein
VESPDQAEVRVLDDSEVETVCEYLGLTRLHQGDGPHLVEWIDDISVGHAYLTLSNPPGRSGSTTIS